MMLPVTRQISFAPRTGRRPQLFWIALLSILFNCFWMINSVYGQEGTGQGTISGLITDEQGTAVANASVTITNVDTNVALRVTSNSTGYYELINLNPGNYQVSAESPNFASFLRKGIVLNIDGHISVDIKLKVGGSTQSVVVVADASLLNTTTGTSVGEVFTTREMNSLPVQNETYLAQLAPGVISNLPQNQIMVGNTSAGGSASQFGAYGRLYSNEFSFDGAPNNATQNISYTPTMDELGEMSTTVQAYSALTGHTYGVSLMQTTKSGTNDWHGSVDEMYWDYRWEAMTHFQRLNDQYEQELNNCVGKPFTGTCLAVENKYGWPGVHENKVGFGFGGPVILPKLLNGRNKLFFFVAGMDDNNASVTATTNSIPTVQERTGDFSDLPASTATPPAGFTTACGTGTPYYGQYQIYNPYNVAVVNGHPQRAPFCGNKIPSNLISTSALVQDVNSFWPTPTSTSTTGSNYTYSQMTPQYNHRFTGRIDYTPTEQDRLFGRVTWQHQASRFEYLMPINNELIDYPFSGFAIGWTHILSPKSVLDVTLGGQRNGEQKEFTTANGYQPNQLGLPSYVENYAGKAAMFPIIQFTGTAYQQVSNSDSNMGWDRSLALRANLTHVQGAHSSAFGGEYRVQVQANGGPGNPSGTYVFDDTYTQENDNTNGQYSQSNTGLSYAAFLLGVQTSASATNVLSFSTSTPFMALYANDTWRATPKVTIVAGLRYELEYGPQEKHNRQIVGWDPNASLPIAGPANSSYQSIFSGATAAEQAVLPATLQIQGGPIYAGVNGASTRQWVNDYRILPRFSIAYQVKPNTVIRGSYGLFFDTLNALADGAVIDQDGFTASTSITSSTDFGVEFTPSAPPISNPFPAQNGANFNSDIGSSAGAMYYAGGSPKIYDHSRIPARSQRGLISVQHQFGPSTVVELAWAGSLTTNITLDAEYNQGGSAATTGAVGARSFAVLPKSLYVGGTQPSFAMNSLLGTQVTNPFAIANFSGLAATNPVQYNLIAHNSYFTAAKITIANLAKAYPQMSALSLFFPNGESKYQSVQATVVRRVSNGLSLVAGLQVNDQHDRDWFPNVSDTSPSWESTNLSRPYRFTARGLYNLPFGRNQAWANSGWKSAAFGGFQLSGTYELQPGALLTFPNAFYLGNTSAIQLKHQPEYNNLGLSGGTAYIQAFNTGNVVSTDTSNVCTNTGTGFVTNSQCQASTYNLREFPSHIEGIRQEGPNTVYASLFRTLPVRERASLSLRFDCFNLLNREIVGAANTTPTSAQFGQITGDGTGYGRWIEAQARLTF